MTLLAAAYYYYNVRPQLARKRLLTWLDDPLLPQAQQIFTDLYQHINAAQISKTERQRLQLADYALTYGEVTFLSFATLLKIAKPKAGEIFYDLGCGAGKAIFIAALLYDLKKFCGIELLPALHQLDLELLDKLQQHDLVKNYYSEKKFNIEFLQQDFFETDLSDADIIFVNATGLFGESWESMVEKLKTLKSGARIILTSKKLDDTHFKLIHNQPYEMTWGICSVSIYSIKARRAAICIAQGASPGLSDNKKQ